jgi:hypothetical protein
VAPAEGQRVPNRAIRLGEVVQNRGVRPIVGRFNYPVSSWFTDARIIGQINKVQSFTCQCFNESNKCVCAEATYRCELTVTDLVAITLCKDDIEILNKSLQDLVNNNIAFEHAVLGVDKVHWDDLRSQVITRLHFVTKHLKEQEEQTKTIAATYSKGVKTRALPKISK